MLRWAVRFDCVGGANSYRKLVQNSYVRENPEHADCMDCPGLEHTATLRNLRPFSRGTKPDHPQGSSAGESV
jgi:hypothetical protein